MRIALPDPCLVVLIGASGSGKSSFAARHFPAVVGWFPAHRPRLATAAPETPHTVACGPGKP